MGITTRLIESFDVGPFKALGAVREADRLTVAFTAGTAARALRAELGGAGELRAVGRTLLAHLPPEHSLAAPTPEIAELQGLNVLLAIRNAETAEATADWLAFHAKHHGAEAALLLNRDPPGGDYARELAKHPPDLPVLLVHTDHPLGLAGIPDARHPSLAPGTPRRDPAPIDAWHAPLAQLAILELLRRRFLQGAGAVILADISDLIDPSEGAAFDRVKAAAGQVQAFSGIECYPWRLRQGRAAPHGDHIARRRGERRRLASWGAVPGALPDTSIWKRGRVAGAEISPDPPIPFHRALGVTFPGVPVNRLVEKANLTEHAGLVDLMHSAFGSDPIRLPQAASIPPRGATASVTVVTAMKNEGPFILDWIAHNRAVGITHHLVYTNDCADGTDQLLDALAQAGVTRRDNPFRTTGNVPQHAALRAAETEPVVEEADWLLAMDVDEYINIHTGAGRIDDLLKAVPEAHVISMPWRLFGNGDRRDFEDRPVTEVFTRAAPEFAPRPLQAWAFKSLYRNAGLFRRIGVHRPKGLAKATRGNISWVDGNGREMPESVRKSGWRMSKTTWGYDLVSLNHYAVRSAESFLVKRDRGRANHTERDQGLAYWFRMNHNAVEDRSIERCARATAAEKARLLALPGVAEGHAASVDWHRERIDTLKADPEHVRLFAEITSPRMENLSRMATKFGAAVHYYGPEVIPDDIAFRDPEEDFFFTVETRDVEAG